MPSRRSPARRRPRPEAVVSWCAIGVLSLTAALAFAPNERSGPVSDAYAEAQRRAAARVLEQRQAVERRSARPVPVAQPLLVGATQVERTGGATRVRLDSLGIDAEVRSVGFLLQGGELIYDTPRFEAGQYVGSADPGERGNLVIGGHVSNRGAQAVFSRLPETKIGDVVEVFSGADIFRYSITELRVVAPDATAVMARTHDATLTLITCSPDLNQQKRLIVVGKLI